LYIVGDLTVLKLKLLLTLAGTEAVQVTLLRRTLASSA